MHQFIAFVILRPAQTQLPQGHPSKMEGGSKTCREMAHLQDLQGPTSFANKAWKLPICVGILVGGVEWIT